MIVVGNAGPDIRSDVKISASPAESFELNICSTVFALYGEQIRTQVEEIWRKFDSPNVRLEIEDSGALPFVIQARLESALAQVMGHPAPKVTSEVRKSARFGWRRTRLYVPGNTPKLHLNLDLYGADAVILDLEDAVSDAQKDEARQLVCHTLAQMDFGESEKMVRINEGARGIADAIAAVAAGAETILIPKVESADQVRELVKSIGERTSLIPLIESPLGVERCFEVAASSPQVCAMSLGLADYLLQLGATRTEAQTESLFAQSRLINAARAAGIQPLASVFPGFEDPQAVLEYAAFARGLGYEGVGCIHPSQIAPVHEAFSAGIEADEAMEIVREFESAMANGVAVIQVRGKMVDKPIYERAKRVLRQGEDGK